MVFVFLFFSGGSWFLEATLFGTSFMYMVKILLFIKVFYRLPFKKKKISGLPLQSVMDGMGCLVPSTIKTPGSPKGDRAPNLNDHPKLEPCLRVCNHPPMPPPLPLPE